MPVNTEAYHAIKEELQSKNVQLVAVSKTKPNKDIEALYALGQRNFGENYVQELVDKAASLPSDIHWHFIGHLQSNKVKFIAPFVYLIHGVDSEKLLAEINKQAIKQNKMIACLLQVHIATEETKFGFDSSTLNEFIKSGRLSNYRNVLVKGLMGMASFTDDQAIVEKEFRTLKNIYDQTATQLNNVHFDTLSMGMSGDYALAIEKGSNLVRIGSLLFGARN
ncbi:MAG: YggS family pyridoxal phosphate-dependent enzyme [Chitinophagia bacterium]|jgi:pyridoxal phosphate enzyme (YggS family)|nr:YggS family pyridoxal phosphate-dependent enzyme [Chitinophagia bacterium]NCA30098.1 YggS family pyridoxal phosphate-dependent enzyme [Chitinophagia bacterium]NDD16759.1 YggS family pyridoxal phosphate-dependent enzyme [Chitinophagia bacterium]